MRLVGELRARGVDALVLLREHARDRVLGEPVDLELGLEAAQLAGNRDIAPGVPEADRGADVEGALAARPPTDPPGGARDRGLSRRLRALGEVAKQQVHLYRVARLRAVARALERRERTAGH